MHSPSVDVPSLFRAAQVWILSPGPRSAIAALQQVLEKRSTHKGNFKGIPFSDHQVVIWNWRTSHREFVVTGNECGQLLLTEHKDRLHLRKNNPSPSGHVMFAPPHWLTMLISFLFPANNSLDLPLKKGSVCKKSAFLNGLKVQLPFTEIPLGITG